MFAVLGAAGSRCEPRSHVYRASLCGPSELYPVRVAKCQWQVFNGSHGACDSNGAIDASPAIVLTNASCCDASKMHALTIGH
jgi:hypothetical protein